jgi:hypothetical protein
VIHLVASLVMLAAPAGPSQATPCRLVAVWDADRDLVVYEVRRDDCATPAPALTGGAPGARRKSLFELYRISTGKLVDAADCQISFSVSGGEDPCDLDAIPRFRKTFARLRAGQRGTPLLGNADELTLPGADGPTVVKPSVFGEAIVGATRTRTHRFVVLARGADQALLRLPEEGAPTERRQRELLTQASLFADAARLDEGRPLVKAARDLGPLKAGMLDAFCAHHDLGRRVDNWRAATRELDGRERAALEIALARRRCFGGVDLALYDDARAPMAAARRWLDAIVRKDMAQARALSAFPLTVQGFVDREEAAKVAACGGRIEERNRLPESTLQIARPEDFEKAAPCLSDPTVEAMKYSPPLQDGRWPPDRGDWFAGWVGTTLPTTLKTLPRDVRRFTAALRPLVAGATLVQAVLTDNAGMTDTFVVVLVPAEADGWRVRAVVVAERFDE